MFYLLEVFIIYDGKNVYRKLPYLLLLQNNPSTRRYTLYSKIHYNVCLPKHGHVAVY